MAFSILTSESVCKGHPDKVADQISDSILDAILAQDPRGRVACETLVTKGTVVLAGEITTTANIDIESIVRGVIRDNGYTNPEWGFNADDVEILIRLQKQSPDIAQGVDNDGAGDQGITYGYATDETPEMMPMPLVIAHRLTAGLDNMRETGTLNILRPDGKSQVSVRYDESGKPVEVLQVTLAAPHDPSITNEELKQKLYDALVVPVLKEYGFAIDIEKMVLNGTGVWHFPGPAADAGLTGRKIVVDSYGGACQVGGGAFSGKDPSKVDRSGAYGARYAAKNIVAAGLAKKVTVQLGWAIGVAEPVALSIETWGATKSEAEIVEWCKQNLITLNVRGIIDGLDLKRPIYRKTAENGHFGKAGFPWEAVVKNEHA